MTNEQVARKWFNGDEVALEAFRRAVSGKFHTEHRRRESLLVYHQTELDEMSRRGMLPKMRPGEDLVLIEESVDPNIVTNQGINYILDAGLSGGTQITAWKVAVFKTDTTPAAGHTYASPSYTEIADADVDENARQAFTDAGVSGQSLSNTASPAVYTFAGTITAYGASIVGGGSGAATIADTGGGGTYYAGSQYAAEKDMTDDDTLTTTYTLGGADDGV